MIQSNTPKRPESDTRTPSTALSELKQLNDEIKYLIDELDLRTAELVATIDELDVSEASLHKEQEALENALVLLPMQLLMLTTRIIIKNVTGTNNQIQMELENVVKSDQNRALHEVGLRVTTLLQSCFKDIAKGPAGKKIGNADPSNAHNIH